MGTLTRINVIDPSCVPPNSPVIGFPGNARPICLPAAFSLSGAFGAFYEPFPEAFDLHLPAVLPTGGSFAPVARQLADSFRKAHVYMYRYMEGVYFVSCECAGAGRGEKNTEIFLVLRGGFEYRGRVGN
jgi:hypothetical protein